MEMMGFPQPTATAASQARCSLKSASGTPLTLRRAPAVHAARGCAAVLVGGGGCGVRACGELAGGVDAGLDARGIQTGACGSRTAQQPELETREAG